MSRSTLRSDVPSHWDVRPLPADDVARLLQLLFAPVADAPEEYSRHEHYPPPRRLRRFLPGKPDTETAFWLARCGAAGLTGLILTAARVQVVIR